MTMIESKKFTKGLSEVRICEATACRQELMEALGVANRQSLYNYATGKHKLDVMVAKEIERIFRKYEVKEPWGEPAGKR